MKTKLNIKVDSQGVTLIGKHGKGLWIAMCSRGWPHGSWKVKRIVSKGVAMTVVVQQVGPFGLVNYRYNSR